MKILKISQVANRLGISKQTLLRYEKKGILPRSKRNHINSWREYTDDDVKRLKQILQRGMTLIESVMIIVVIGILAALVIPRFEGFYATKLESAVKKIMTDIRFVQQMAISRHANTRIVFYLASNAYTAQEENATSAGTWNQLFDPATRASLSLDFDNDKQYSGITMDSASFQGTNILAFDWKGNAVSGGQIHLIYRDFERTVSVGNNTGRVTVQ